MRRSLIPLLAAVLAFSCADVPTTPLLVATAPNFGVEPGDPEGDPPPPWAIIIGSGTTETGAFSYTANFFVNPVGTVAWVKFTGGTNVTFSRNARIMYINGDVKGMGTLTVGTTTYQLSSVNKFDFDGRCTVNRSSSCASFSGTGFSSARSTYTGYLAGGRDFGKGGSPPIDCIDACYIVGTQKR